MYYVDAETDEGENVCLLVRAATENQAEHLWREHFDGWDLPGAPRGIKRVPVTGAAGAIPWDQVASFDDPTRDEANSLAGSMK